MSDQPIVLERVTTPRGELVLPAVGEALEVISNGVFLMDTRDGRSERALVREAAASHPHPRRLIGGHGVGYSVHLRDRTGDGLTDQRVQVVVTDVRKHLAAGQQSYDVICLDVDNGPDWTVTERRPSTGVRAAAAAAPGGRPGTRGPVVRGARRTRRGLPRPAPRSTSSASAGCCGLDLHVAPQLGRQGEEQALLG